MLKKLKVTASVLAVSAMFLMPTAHAEQAAVMPVQEDENCIKAVMEFLGIDTEESKFGLGGSLFRKNGFEVQDGRLYHYTDSWMSISPVLCRSKTECTMCQKRAAPLTATPLALQ